MTSRRVTDLWVTSCNSEELNISATFLNKSFKMNGFGKEQKVAALLVSVCQ